MKFALRSKASYNSNITWMEHENNMSPTKEAVREQLWDKDLSHSCSRTATKTCYQIALYKQHEWIKPYLSEYNLSPFTTMDQL